MNVGYRQFVGRFFISTTNVRRVWSVLVPKDGAGVHNIRSLLSNCRRGSVAVLSNVSRGLIIAGLPFQSVTVTLTISTLLRDASARLPLQVDQGRLMAKEVNKRPICISNLGYDRKEVVLGVLRSTFLCVVVRPRNRVILTFCVHCLSTSVTRILRVVTRDCRANFLVLNARYRYNRSFRMNDAVRLPNVRRRRLFLNSIRNTARVEGARGLLSGPRRPINELFLRHLHLLRRKCSSRAVLTLVGCTHLNGDERCRRRYHYGGWGAILCFRRFAFLCSHFFPGFAPAWVLDRPGRLLIRG